MRPLSIIILQYNNSQLTIDLIKSIYKFEKSTSKWDIFIVDNNSTETDMFDVIHELFPMIKTIKNHNNLGFAGGINSVAQQLDTKYLLLINNDMLLLNNAISLTLKDAVSYNTDSISCRILGPNGKPQNTTNLKLTTFNILLSLFGLMKLFHLLKNRRIKPIRVGYINGAFLMVNLAMFKDAGMFNDSFFMYGEDIDLMLRLNKKNAKMLYSPKGEIKHLDGASALKLWNNNDKYLLKIKNSLRAHKINKSNFSFQILKIVLIIKELTKYLLFQNKVFISSAKMIFR